MTTKSDNIIALDVGERRIGVAIANKYARLARPLEVMPHNENIWADIKLLITREHADIAVVGLPRNLSGDDTDQTAYVRKFASHLQEISDCKVVLQDEALTSKQAEAELDARGQKYSKGDIDALAAVYILEDYLASIDSMEARH